MVSDHADQVGLSKLDHESTSSAISNPHKSLTKTTYPVYIQHSVKKYTVQYEDITSKVRRLATILLRRRVVADMTLSL